MKYHAATLWVFALFLVGYFAQKYLAAAPPIYVPAYVSTVMIICITTALIPFGLAAIVGDAIENTFAAVIAIPLLSVVLSILGFAAFWYFAISGQPSAPPLEAVAPRGLTPGLFISAILIGGRLLRTT